VASRHSAVIHATSHPISANGSHAIDEAQRALDIPAGGGVRMEFGNSSWFFLGKWWLCLP
jgi:hypothetical protein